MSAETILVFRIQADTGQLEAGLTRAAAKGEQAGAKMAAGAKKAETAWNKFAASMKTVSVSMIQIGTGISSLGRAMTIGLTVPLVAAAATSAKFASDFQVQMFKIRNQVGITQDVLDGWQKGIRTISRNTGRDLVELGEALFFVTSAGVRDATKSMNVLRLSAQAAAQELGTTAEFARALTAAMNTYGKSGISAAEISEVLFKTVREGAFVTSELAKSIGTVIGIAKNANVSINDLGASFAAFTRVGVGTRIAATGIRAALNKLVLGPSPQTQKALEGIGLSAVKLRRIVQEQGLPELMVSIFDALKDAGPEASSAINKIVPNIRGLAFALSTAGANSADFLKIAKELRKDTDFFAESFANAQKLFKVNVDRIIASLRIIQERFGKVLIDLFNDKVAPIIMKVLIPALEALVVAFDNLPGPIQAAIVAAGGLVALGGPVAFAVGSLITTLGQLSLTVIAAPMAWNALKGQFLATGLASGKLKTSVKNLLSPLAKLAPVIRGTSLAGTALKGVLGRITPVLIGWPGIIAGIVAMFVDWSAVWAAFKSLGDPIVRILQSVGNHIKDLSKWIMEQTLLGAELVKFWEKTTKLLGIISNLITGSFLLEIGKIKAGLNFFADAIENTTEKEKEVSEQAKRTAAAWKEARESAEKHGRSLKEFFNPSVDQSLKVMEGASKGAEAWNEALQKGVNPIIATDMAMGELLPSLVEIRDKFNDLRGKHDSLVDKIEVLNQSGAHEAEIQKLLGSEISEVIELRRKMGLSIDESILRHEKLTKKKGALKSANELLADAMKKIDQEFINIKAKPDILAASIEKLASSSLSVEAKSKLLGVSLEELRSVMETLDPATQGVLISTLGLGEHWLELTQISKDFNTEVTLQQAAMGAAEENILKFNQAQQAEIIGLEHATELHGSIVKALETQGMSRERLQELMDKGLHKLDAEREAELALHDARLKHKAAIDELVNAEKSLFEDTEKIQTQFTHLISSGADAETVYRRLGPAIDSIKDEYKKLNKELPISIRFMDSFTQAAGRQIRLEDRLSSARQSAISDIEETQDSLAVLITKMNTWKDATGASDRFLVDKFGPDLVKAGKILREFGGTIDESTAQLIRQAEQAKRNSETAKQLRRAWATAMGEIAESFAEGLSGMIFEGEKFSFNLKEIFVALSKALIKIMITNTFLKIAGKLSDLPGIGFLFGGDKKDDPGAFGDNVRITPAGSQSALGGGIGNTVGTAAGIGGVLASLFSGGDSGNSSLGNVLSGVSGFFGGSGVRSGNAVPVFIVGTAAGVGDLGGGSSIISLLSGLLPGGGGSNNLLGTLLNASGLQQGSNFLGTIGSLFGLGKGGSGLGSILGSFLPGGGSGGGLLSSLGSLLGGGAGGGLLSGLGSLLGIGGGGGAASGGILSSLTGMAGNLSGAGAANSFLGFLGGLGSPASGAGAAAGGAGGGLMSSIGGLLTNPFTAVAAAVIAAIVVWKKQKSTEEKLADEAARDFGIKVSDSITKSFFEGLSADEDTVKGLRKDITSSPKFLEEVLLPAAKQQGDAAVQGLIASFGRLQVSNAVGEAAIKANPSLKFVKDAAGEFFFDISDSVREAVETGNFDKFNQAFRDIFDGGGQLTRLFPEWAKELLSLAGAFGEAAEAAEALGSVADEVSGVFGGGLADAAAAAAKIGDFLPGTGERVLSQNPDGTTTVFGGLSGFRTVGSVSNNTATSAQGGSITGGNQSAIVQAVKEGKVAEGLLNNFPLFDRGGFVKRGGFALLHDNEFVLSEKMLRSVFGSGVALRSESEQGPFPTVPGSFVSSSGAGSSNESSSFGGGPVNLTMHVKNEIPININSSSDDLARVTREVVVPEIESILRHNQGGLAESFERSMNKVRKGTSGRQ